MNNNQKSILVFLFILFQMSIFAQTRVCFDVLDGSAAIPEFTFTYNVKTHNSTINGLQPVKDGDCWLMTFEGIDPSIMRGVVIEAENDQDPLNGVTTYDMILIARMLVGIDDNQDCTNEEKVIKILSSDVNFSGSISTFDLVQLRQLILHITSDLPNNQSWRFINGNGLKAYVNDPKFDIDNLFTNTTANALSLDYSLKDLEYDISVVAYKIGDVNGACN